LPSPAAFFGFKHNGLFILKLAWDVNIKGGVNMLSVLKESCAQYRKCKVLSIFGNELSSNRGSVMNDRNNIRNRKDVMDTHDINDTNQMNRANIVNKVNNKKIGGNKIEQ
jgi:hypothetical protein